MCGFGLGQGLGSGPEEEEEWFDVPAELEPDVIEIEVPEETPEEVPA